MLFSLFKHPIAALQKGNEKELSDASFAKKFRLFGVGVCDF